MCLSLSLFLSHSFSLLIAVLSMCVSSSTICVRNGDVHHRIVMCLCVVGLMRYITWLNYYCFKRNETYPWRPSSRAPEYHKLISYSYNIYTIYVYMNRRSVILSLSLLLCVRCALDVCVVRQPSCGTLAKGHHRNFPENIVCISSPPMTMIKSSGISFERIFAAARRPW